MAIKRWTDEEIAILRKEYPKGGAKGVSAILTDRRLYQKHKAESLGIKTTACADAIAERERAILEYIRDRGEFTREEIENEFFLSIKQVQFFLTELSKKGTIKYSRGFMLWSFVGDADAVAIIKAREDNSENDMDTTRTVIHRNHQRIDDSKFITDDDLEWMRTWKERAAARNELRERYLEQKSTENQFR